MFREVDTNGDSFRLIAEEFEKTYGDLGEKAKRVRVEDAEKVGLEFPLAPLEIRRVAVQIASDTILDEEVAFRLLYREYERVKSKGFGIPEVPTFEFNFAVEEGRWIEFLNNKFVRYIEDNTREITNLENALKGSTVEDTPIEKVLELITVRKKIREKYIVPIMNKWLKEHKGSYKLEAIAVFGATLLRTDYETVLKYFEQAKEEYRNIIEFLIGVLENEKDSRTVRNVKQDLIFKRAQLVSPIDELDVDLLADLLVQITPSPELMVTDSKIIIRHTPFPKTVSVGPVLTEPVDFLERDIKLVKRLPTVEAEERLKHSIRQSLKAYLSEEKNAVESTVHMIVHLNKRFDKEVENEEALLEDVQERVKGLSNVGKMEVLREILFKYIIDNFL
ncbi:MAG: hypothetical protein ACTSUV_04360 [Candidatus Ranarchaeia archaeon]